MIILARVAHCPAAGVKVYSVVGVFVIAGDQVPVMPFKEVVGKALRFVPKHRSAKVGVTG